MNSVKATESLLEANKNGCFSKEDLVNSLAGLFTWRGDLQIYYTHFEITGDP